MLIILIIFASLSLSNSLLLRCEYFTQQFVIVGNQYACRGTIVNSGDPNIVTEVSQNHLAGRSNANVSVVQIASQPIVNFPSNIDKFFENIRSFQLRNSTLRKLTSSNIRVFPKLEAAGFHSNLLEEIDGDLFSGNPLLQHINLSGNRLTSVGPNIFHATPILSQINLLNNICVQENVNVASGVAELSRKLRHQCPATVEMIERFILDGEKFQRKVDEQTAERINPAVLRIHENEQKINELERLLNELLVENSKS